MPANSTPLLIGIRKYPHVFGNTIGVDDVNVNPICAGAEVFEFPILNDGTVLAVGPNNKVLDVGTERVLFQVDEAGNTKYCGIVTHHLPTIPGTGWSPFSNC